MDVSAVVTILAAIIALAALYFTRRQVQAADEQTSLQRELQRDATQPYVWADIRLHKQHASVFMLILKNEGPTVATDVTMTFDPPLPAGWRGYGGNVGPSTATGSTPGTAHFSALPPGRVMQWNLGVPWDILKSTDPLRFAVIITAKGPGGQVPLVRYVVDLNEYMNVAKTAPGTPLSIVKAIDDGFELLEKSLGRLADRLPADPPQQSRSVGD